MMGSSQRLKSLQTQLKDAMDAFYTKRDASRFAVREEREASDKVARIRAEMDALSKEDIVVTEHAYVRYFERVLGYDLEKVKDEILPKQDRDRLLNSFGTREWRVGESHKVTIRDGRVITVTPPDPKPVRIRPIIDDDESDGGDFGEVGVVDEDSESWRGSLL